MGGTDLATVDLGPADLWAVLDAARACSEAEDLRQFDELVVEQLARLGDRDRAVLDLFRRQVGGVHRLLRRPPVSGPVRSAPEAPADGQGTWVLGLLGGFRLSGPHGPVRMEGKTAALVKLLALVDRPVPLDQVTECLWPGADPATARPRLRGVLHRVPRDPLPLVVRMGEALALGPGVHLDTVAFEASARAALAAVRLGDPSALEMGEAALAAYPDDVLPEDAYEDWAAGPRERLRRRRLELLDALAGRAEAEGDVGRATSLLADAVEVDPVDEARQLRLGWLLVAAGRRGAARRVAERVERTSAELDLPVSQALRDLREALRA